ncbi:MAG: NAD(P)/FAD-dependent oxidoreductase [Tumebacillaceae bacterium]
MRKDVVIVGGGPAGMSAAIWCKRLGLEHLLVEASGELGGQLFQIHNPVIDYPGLLADNGRAVQKVFAEHVQQLECAHQLEADVQAVDVENMALTLRVAQNAAQGSSQGSSQGAVMHVEYRGLIVATGSSERRLHVPGEMEMIERGEVYSASRDRDRFAGRRVAVVGGGDRAVEGALLLAERGANVVLIHRSDRFRARDSYLQPVLAHPQIEVRSFATVVNIIGDEQVRGVIIAQNGQETQLDVDAIFVRIGVAPNSDLLRGQVRTDEDGYLVTDEVGRTDREGVFAIGDVCTRPLYSSIASAVGQGMTAAKHLSLYLAQKGAEL